MKIFIKAKTGAKVDKVERVGKNRYDVSVKARPIKGAANKRVIEVLSTYLKVPKSRMEIKSGLNSRNKILEIIN